MSETSREYWQNTKRYARNAEEIKVGEPSYYGTQRIISDKIGTLLVAAEAPREWSILEVGCNCGKNMNWLHSIGYKNIRGVEISSEAAEYAWSVYPTIADRIVVSDAQSFLAMRYPNSYDVIYTQSVLMHVPPEEDYLFAQMSRVASKIILTCEVEMDQISCLIRHKFARNYKDVFEALGWKQLLDAKDDRRALRVFKK
jgi:2-polyprenyl-3-methyl-5-hydroxy-6-metoxy-1,4-benzoquinol methylase